MKTSTIQCFYHPSTVIIVDDNEDFLDNLPANLCEHSNYLLFDSPQQALQLINAREDSQEESAVAQELLNHFSHVASLGDNIKKHFHKNRNNIPSVIIIDHDMPGVNGIEFCQKLIEHPIKKIMLTGVADDKLAVQAFNDGIIDRFISKNDSNVFEKLNNAITDLQHKYFSSISDVVFKNILSVNSSFLNNTCYKNFLTNFILENQISEYYLIDTLGSYVLKNKAGVKMHLMIQSSNEIENYIEAAKDHDAPFEIIQALESRDKLLCLLTEDDTKKPVNMWHNHLHSASPIDGLDDVYYSIIT